MNGGMIDGPTNVATDAITLAYTLHVPGVGVVCADEGSPRPGARSESPTDVTIWPRSYLAQPMTYLVMIRRGYYTAIDLATKLWEVRLNEDRLAKAEERDALLFQCGPQRMRREILEVRRFRSLEALFDVVPPGECLPGHTRASALEV